MENLCPIYTASNKYPKEIAFHYKDREVSFSELELLVGGVAKKLSALELGQRVSVVSGNSLEMIVLLFALQRLGVSVVLHNIRLKPEDWKEQAQLAGVCAAFVAEEFKGQGVFEREFSVPELGLEVAFEPQVDLEKEAFVIFTSGSTGLGKGVRLSLANLISNAEASNLVNELSEGDSWLASLPFFHVGGLCIVFRTLLAGASSLIAEAKDTYQLLDKVSHVSLVPTVLEDILRREGGYEKLRKLKNILFGGAPSNLRLLEKIKELPVRTSYGMTETSSHICMLEKKSVYVVDDLKTSGNLLKGVEAKISIEGEICLKGPSIFKGYLGKDERVLDDWFLTGDLGSIDFNGRLIVEGRKDRTIISGGENINPKQIEDIALSCEGVKEIVVVGVDDPKWGSRPVAYVVIDEGFDLSILNTLFERSLPKFKIPDKIIKISSMPKTAIGKVDYKTLSNNPN